MSVVKGTTNFDGGVNDLLYLALGVGNETIQKQGAWLRTDISEKEELGYLSGTANPIRAWVASPTFPASETQTITHAKRDLTPQKTMILTEFTPDDWLGFWEKWQAIGDYTNLGMNPNLIRDVLELTANNAGTQLSKLFWQGDTAGAAGSNEFDGIVKLALADANVIDVPTLGAINKANVTNVVEDVWENIPRHIKQDPACKIHMSGTDFDFLQQANLDAMKSTTGVLQTEQGMSFLGTKIEHFEGLTAGSIVAAVSGEAGERSNLVMGVWVDPETEMQNVRIDRITNASEEWFMRINIKVGAQYRYGGDIVLYQPV